MHHLNSISNSISSNRDHDRDRKITTTTNTNINTNMKTNLILSSQFDFSNMNNNMDDNNDDELLKFLYPLKIEHDKLFNEYSNSNIFCQINPKKILNNNDFVKYVFQNKFYEQNE